MLWEYAIDAGSETLRLVKRGTAQIVCEPSYTAARKGRSVPMAWGERAKQLLGREPEGVTVTKSINGGIVDHPQLFARWTKIVLDEDEATLRKRQVLVSAGPEMKQDQREEMQKCMLEEGVSSVALVSAVIAAALGAGEKVMEPEGVFVMDIGAEQVHAAVISGGRVVRCENLPYGINRAQQLLTEAVRIYLGFAIGPHTARELILESVKEEADDKKTIQKPGFDVRTSLPGMVDVPVTLAMNCVEKVMEAAAEMCGHIALFLPEALAGDAYERGFVVTGGGACTLDAAEYVKRATGLPARTAEEPESCIAKGLQKILADQDKYKKLIENEMEARRA